VKRFLLAFLLVLSLWTIQVSLERVLAMKPAAEKVGFVANPYVMRFISADHKETIAALLAIKSLIYYGTLVEEQRRNNKIPVDYDGLFQLLFTATRLDPYNTDTYYFSQSILAWKSGFARQVVRLLDYGMGFRTWDWMLPFWAGFDSVNFFKNYHAAAEYYAKAGELSNANIFSRLSARYLYESNQTSHAIAYLETMIKGARKPSIRKTLELRLLAFKQVEKIEKAINSFKIHEKKSPANLDELIRLKYLKTLPTDPYGGEFYLDENGKPRTTSAFSNVIK